MKTKNARMYGLFVMENGKWIRLHPELKFSKQTAIRVFQSQLLELSFSGKRPALRTV